MDKHKKGFDTVEESEDGEERLTKNFLTVLNQNLLHRFK